MTPWLVTLAALLLAAASWIAARRATRQVRDLTQMYWQLKFEHGELKARVERLHPDPVAPPRMPAGTQFVPLTSVKK